MSADSLVTSVSGMDPSMLLADEWVSDIFLTPILCRSPTVHMTLVFRSLYDKTYGVVL